MVTCPVQGPWISYQNPSQIFQIYENQGAGHPRTISGRRSLSRKLWDERRVICFDLLGEKGDACFKTQQTEKAPKPIVGLVRLSP